MVAHTVAAFLLAISLSTQGYWLAEHPVTVRISRTTPEHATDSVLHWQLLLDELQLAQGVVPMAADDEFVTIDMIAPNVRVPTQMRWAYTLRSAADDKVLTRGEVAVHVYPDNQLAGIAKRLDESIAVLAKADAPLVAMLEEANLPHKRAEHASQLRMQTPGIVLVASGWLKQPQGRNEEQILRQLAERGSGVIIFEHADTQRLMNLRLRRRPAPDQAIWHQAHPLWRGLAEGSRHSWLRDQTDVWAIELTSDEPALELAYWPLEVEDVDVEAVDVLVLTQSIGEGRVVLWQIPLGSWAQDPRSQMLLANAIDYLTTPTNPTPSLQERRKKQKHKAEAEGAPSLF